MSHHTILKSISSWSSCLKTTNLESNPLVRAITEVKEIAKLRGKVPEFKIWRQQRRPIFNVNVKLWFFDHWQILRPCNNFSTNFYINAHEFTDLYNFHISKFMDPDIQAFVKSTLELYGHFISLHVTVRYHLYTKHNGNTGRRIHEVQCTRPASP